MVKVYVVFKSDVPYSMKIFKKQEDAEKYCADRNTDMYSKTYGYSEFELE